MLERTEMGARETKLPIRDRIHTKLWRESEGLGVANHLIPVEVRLLCVLQAGFEEGHVSRLEHGQCDHRRKVLKKS